MLRFPGDAMTALSFSDNVMATLGFSGDVMAAFGFLLLWLIGTGAAVFCLKAVEVAFVVEVTVVDVSCLLLLLLALVGAVSFLVSCCLCCS